MATQKVFLENLGDVTPLPAGVRLLCPFEDIMVYSPNHNGYSKSITVNSIIL
jgi:hypothetical protein